MNEASFNHWKVDTKRETEEDMKMKAGSRIDNSKTKSSCKEATGFVQEGKGRLYIFGRCVAMLLCWHD